MKKTILAAFAAAIGLGMTAPALAGGKHGHRHHPHHSSHRHWDHQRHHHHPRVHRHVVRERVVIERPVYVAPPAYSRYYHAPRHPGIVVSVDIPPLVIPLR